VPYTLLIDVVVALLLVVTISYAVRLNKRLGMMRRDKAELEKLAIAFSESTVRADESLGRLRSTADMMQRQIESAQGLHDDLAYLIDRGEKAADRLEEAVRVSRDFDRRSAKPSSSEMPAETSKDAPPQKSAPGASASGRPAAPEVNDINEGMSRPAPAVKPREGEDVSTRTEAERELLKALRSAN